MAVNKNFVVKNGLEVNENLIVANATDSFVGVGTSTPNNTLHVFGGIGATDVRVTGISSFIQNVYVGASGTTFSVVDITGSNAQVGIGTDLPAYLLDIRSAVSTGQTALYVQGDARVTGDLIADDITLDQANFTNINVTGFTTTGELVVGYGASITGVTTLGHLSRAAAGSGGTSITFNPAAGISTAASTSAGIVSTLALSSAQDHKVTVSGISTFTCNGGTEGDSHTLRITNSGITTIGFSTYFLFPSGSEPSIPTADGTVSLISFTVHRVGTPGIATQLLAGASLNFS